MECQFNKIPAASFKFKLGREHHKESNVLNEETINIDLGKKFKNNIYSLNRNTTLIVYGLFPLSLSKLEIFCIELCKFDNHFEYLGTFGSDIDLFILFNLSSSTILLKVLNQANRFIQLNYATSFKVKYSTIDSFILQKEKESSIMSMVNKKLSNKESEREEYITSYENNMNYTRSIRKKSLCSLIIKFLINSFDG